MAKKSKTKVIGHGVDYINLPKENASTTYTQTTSTTGPTGLPTSGSTLTLKQEHPLASLNNPTTTNPTAPVSFSQKTYQSTFNPSDLTNHYKSTMLSSESGRPDDYEAPEFSTSPLTDRYSGLMLDTEGKRPEDYVEPTFSTSDLTNRYSTRMQEAEDNKPAAYSSQYEATINDILDTIKNRKSFDVKDDANYNALYDQYAERYRANAQRAMNDAMASANAATGGYGSTYAQAVGQQAYDRTMEGLNDNNMALLNLAYDIYSGDRANDYNMLNAYQNVDNVQYGRYRDDVNDWQNERNYYSNQYQTNYANDRNAFENDRNFGYGAYRDKVADWQNDRGYYAGQYQQNYANDRSAFENDRSFDYGTYRDQVADWQNDRNYNAGQYWNSYGNDRNVFEDERNFGYTASQDEIKRDDANYQDALTQAMALAKEGLPVPSYITDRINQYNTKYGLSGDAQAALAQLAATALASGGSGGSGGGRRGRGSSSKSKSTTSDEKNNSIGVVSDRDLSSMYNQIKKNNSGTVLDRVNADEYLDDVIKNNFVSFAPRIGMDFADQVGRDLGKETVTDTLNRLALEKKLKRNK
jgi:hypothetical protein